MKRPNRRRKKRMNRTCTPLLIGDPPAALVNRLYREARAAVLYTGGTSQAIESRQRWFAKIQAEFTRRLNAFGVYVEGLSS